MKNNQRQRWLPSFLTRLLPVLVALFTLSVGNVWGTEIYSFAMTSSTAAIGTYSATGGTAEVSGSAFATGGSNEVTVGSQVYYKFNSSSTLVVTLSNANGNFAIGDVITFTCAANASSAKNGKGVKIGPNGSEITLTGNFPAAASNTLTYTVAKDDGIAGTNTFKVKRADSDVKFGVVSVDRSASTSYTLSFNANGGTGTVADITGSGSNTLPAANAFTAPDGKEFKEWNTKDDGTGTTYAAGASYSLSANATLYAIWQDVQTKYALTFAAGEGTGSMAALEYAENAEVTLPACTFIAPAGKAFDKWASTDVTITDGKFNMPAKAVTVTATWEEVPVDIFTMVAASGAISKSVDAGSTIALTSNEATITGGSVNFKNNNTAAKNVGSKQSNTSCFMLEKTGSYFEIVLPAAGDGLRAGDVITASVLGGKDERGIFFTTSATNTALTTYFVKTTSGESSNTIKTGLTYTVKADDDLVGAKNIYVERYTGNGTYFSELKITRPAGSVPNVTHDVTFDMNGATSTALEAQKIVDGKKLVAPTAPTKDGYAFVKWVVASTEADYDFDAAVTGDLALKAVWVKTWTVSFDMNGATSEAIAAQTVKDGEKATKPEDPEQTGSAFGGWYKGAAAFDFDTPITENIELTAQWITSVKVTYYDGSTKLAEVDNVKGAAPSDYADYQTKKLHTFVKWYTDAELTVEADMTAVLNADATFYGKWEKVYATDVDFAAVADGSAGTAAEVIAAHNMAITGGATSWDNNTSSNNGSYQGLKMKEANSTVEFYAPAAKMVVLKVGILVNSKSDMYQNGVKVNENMAGGSKTEGDNFKLYYYYSDEVALYKFQTTSADAQIIKAISFVDPYTVTFTVPEGADAVAAQQFKAQAITLPTAVKGTENFIGWYDAATEGNKIGDAGDNYTPAGDVELFAHFEAVSSDNSIQSLKYKKTGDADYTVIAITDENQKTYNVTIPYKTTVAEVVYEKNHAAATAGDVALNAGVATFKVTAENGTEADYTVNFTNAPKDGVCLIHADITGQGAASVDAAKSAIGGTAAANGSVKGSTTFDGETGYKFNSSGAKFNMALAEGNFKAGDVIKVFVTTAQAMPIRVYSDEAATNEVATGAANMVQGANTATLTADASALWLVRTDANGWNPNVAYVEVYRPMNPVLTKATFAGVDATINEAAKTVTVEVPFTTDVTALTPALTYISNDNAQVVVNPAGAADYSSELTLTLTDKDGDYSDYTVTVTKAAASDDATLSDIKVGGTTVTDFDAATLAYTVEREFGDAVIPEVTYTKNHAGANVVAATADNVVTLTVTAEDGLAQKAYTVTFTNKAAATDATLKSLTHGTTAINLVADQYTYTVNLPYSDPVGDVPALIAEVNEEHATKVVTDAAAFDAEGLATSTVVVTAQDGTTKKTYTVNFVKALYPSVVIFDGSSMSTMATSPSGAISWAVEGSTMTAGDKSKSYNGKDYTRALSCGNSSTTKYFTITVADNNAAKIHVVGMSNSSSDTRHAWLTNSTEKGEYDAAIAGLASTGYNPEEFTTAWLEEGTYYLHADNTVAIFEISVEHKAVDPKCEAPVISAQPETNKQFGAGDMTASVTATVTDGGTLSYQWYTEAGDIVAGATDATLTTATDGKYYVIVTNTLADHRNNTAKSDVCELGHRALNDATLSALSYGSTAITLVNGQYEYAVELPSETTDVPALSATTNSSYATKDINNAAAFVNYEASSTVVVTAEDGTTQLTYTVKFVVDHHVDQADVTGDMTWNFADVPQDAAAAASDGIKATEANQVMANINNVNNLTFGAQYLVMGNSGDYAYRSSSNKCFQGKSLKFHTTVTGLVTINARKAGNGTANLTIGTKNFGDISTTTQDYKVIVPAGDVEISVEGNQPIRIFSMKFEVFSELRSSLPAGKIVTMCQAKAIEKIEGATAYEVEKRNSIGIDLVEATLPLTAGKPYILQADGGNVYVRLTGDAAADVVAANGLVGNLSTASGNLMLPDGEDTYIFLNNHLCAASGSNGNYVAPDRAYLNLDAVTDNTTSEPAGVTRRRISMGITGTGMVTGLETLEAEGKSVKFIQNGQLFILRDGKIFNAQGQFVK